jgi:hypothetical protein
MTPAAGLVDDVDAVVLAIGSGDAQEEREPAPKAKAALVGQAPFEHELVALAAKVLSRVLADAVQEDLVVVPQPGR